ncbi:MAG: hypothetical protein J6S60_09235 [Oscillospiraceae bacterium]|nr:hypothetical protein [Oscillospiraceae bacterium]
MLQAIVIKSTGDPRVAGQIVRGLAAPELRRLRAEVRQLRRRDAIYWTERLAEADRKYARAIRPRSRLYKGLWSLIGLAVMLRQEGRGAA